MTIEKNQNPGAVLELPIWPNFEVNGLDWQCCLAGSSKKALPMAFLQNGSKVFNFFNCPDLSIIHSSYALTFFGYIILVLANVTQYQNGIYRNGSRTWFWYFFLNANANNYRFIFFRPLHFWPPSKLII